MDGLDSGNTLMEECVSLYPIIWFTLQVTIQNRERVFAKCLWLCFISIPFHSQVLCAFYSDTKFSWRVISRRLSCMPKYRYLVLSLAVQVWWVAPGQQPNAHLPTQSLPAGWRESRRQKDSQIEIMMVLIRKAKAVHKQSKKRNLFTIFHCQEDVHPFWGEQGFVTCNSYLGIQMLLGNHKSLPPIPPPFPELLLLSIMS